MDKEDNIIESAAGDIHVPSSKIPFDVTMQYTPNLPFTIFSKPENPGYGASTHETGVPENIDKKESGGFDPLYFFKKIYDPAVYGAEFYEFNETLKFANYGYQKLFKEPYDEADPNFNPFDRPELFSDIDKKFLPYLAGARGSKDLEYRHQRVLEEQKNDELLENGSMFSRIAGGLNGALLDPIGWIPIVGWAKYAKLAPTFFASAARALPGVGAYSIASSAAKQLDKVNGNLSDFVLDSGINTVFGMAIFGGLGAGSLAIDKMELWGLRDLAKGWVKGVDFKFALSEKGEVTGYKAFDTTGTLSAAEVTFYQELADSSFHKGGLFKVPYLGTGILKLAGSPIFGSPLVAGIASPYKTVRAFFDRAADHGFLTKGVAEGGTQPKSFEHLLKRDFADLKSIATQMNALHLERMGFSIDNRMAQDITKAGLGLYNASMKTIVKDMEKTGYVTREAFDDEIQQVIISGKPSEHAAVNEAASMAEEQFKSVWERYHASRGTVPPTISPKMARSFLTRVYDTNFLNSNKQKWTQVISDYLQEADGHILNRMEPIHALENQIKEFEKLHTEAVDVLGQKAPPVTSKEVTPHLKRYRYIPPKALPNPTARLEHTGTPAADTTMQLREMKEKLRALKDELQNELRSDPEHIYHIEDIFALSANEAKELTQLLSKKNGLQKSIEEQQKVVSELKSEKSKNLSTAKRKPTKEKAKPHAEAFVENKAKIAEEEEKLNQLKRDLEDEEYNLYSKARNGEVNEAFYYPETHQYKDPNYRLKFRETYGNHFERQNHAEAYWSSIMHMNPEDIISDIMGRLNGHPGSNPLKSRSILVPDEVLYNNNFMTKDLMAKLNNYTLYLGRRTNLKNVFKDVTHDGGIEPLIKTLVDEHNLNRSPLDMKKDRLNKRLAKVDKKLNSDKYTSEQKEKFSEHKEKLEKQAKQFDKKLESETKRFNKAKEQMQNAYERMMGLRKRERWEIITQGIVRSFAAMANLHFLPATQIADLGAIALQAGAWPFARDGVIPFIKSLGGLIKTKDSEAIRETLPHIHLGLQDVLNGHAEKNLAMETQPYLNMGPTVSAFEKMAHYSSNLDLTTYIDNFLQKLAGATYQSKFMKALIDHTKGKLSSKDSEMLRRYGIDPDKWADRMVKSYKEAKGFKTSLGGHQSMFWKWQDLEASNEMQSAVFRGVQNTIITRGMFDSPYWADNLLGMIFHTFTGWGYASFNRFVLPTLQRPDAEKALGVTVALGFGAMVGPLRRLARGEDAYAADATPEQIFWEVVNDSAPTAALANIISYANVLSGDRLLGDLKSDKYKNRMNIGAGSVIFGTANRLGNIFTALSSGEFNQQDAKQMARLLPIVGSIYGYNMSKMFIENSGLPLNRNVAHAE